MLPARQALIKKAFHEEQSSKTSGLTLASRLSYELGLYGKNKIQWKLWNIEKNGWMKNGHSKDAPLILLVKLSLREWVSLSGCNEEKSQLQKNVAVIFHIF